jgi:myo-inositol-1(or 4)-monophosphatase
MESNISANLHVIISACQKVQRFVLRDFGEIEQLQPSISGVANFAAASKFKIEKTLVENLLEARPKYGVLTPSEESRGADVSHRFIVNALDGFENYARGIPMFAVSVALQEQKKLVAAAVYNPILDKMFYAEKGGGAFVSEARMTRRIRVSQRFDSTVGARIAVSPGGRDTLRFKRPLPAADIGSDAMALAYLASGQIDGFIGFGRSIFSIGAGALLVSEAGGKVSSFDADFKPSDRIFEAEVSVLENSYLQPDLISNIIR